MDNHQHQHENERASPRHKPFVARCCSCPRVLASSIFRRIGRCMFVSCYPVIQCFGCDNHRHRHHKHFFWFILHYCLWLCRELQGLNFKALVTSKFSLLVPTHLKNMVWEVFYRELHFVQAIYIEIFSSMILFQRKNMEEK